MNYRIYCIFSKESLKKMNGIRGKMASQAGHAFLHAYWNAEHRFPEDAEIYRNSDHTRKITCVVDTDQELELLYDEYVDNHPITKVIDSGFTVFNEPTLTCIGIGPVDLDKLQGTLVNLKTLT